MESSASPKDETADQAKPSSDTLNTCGESTKENTPSTSEDPEKKECPFKSLHILPRESYIRFILRLERLYRSRRVPFRYTPCDYFYPPDMLEKAMETTRNLAQQQRDHPPDTHDEPDEEEEESEDEESEEEESEDESPPPSPDNSRTKICPFDPEHVVPKEFYLRHLVFCRRHFGQFRISCPYRPWEFFYPQEMLKHMTKCPGAPRSRTYEEHKAVFENHYRREEFYPKDQLKNSGNASGESEDDEEDTDGPIRCPYNPEELIYRDMIEDHILRCDYADEWYRKNPINTDDESDSD